MRILITGVAGFIGSNLAQRFLEEKHEVIGIDNYITGSESAKHSLVCFSLVVSSGLEPLLTASTAFSTGMVYCLQSFTPSMRSTSSDYPWLTPLPQKV